MPSTFLLSLSFAAILITSTISYICIPSEVFNIYSMSNFCIFIILYCDIYFYRVLKLQSYTRCNYVARFHVLHFSLFLISTRGHFHAGPYMKISLMLTHIYSTIIFFVGVGHVCQMQSYHKNFHSYL